MDALKAWGDARLGRGPTTIWSCFREYGVHAFLIAFACVYYVSNAPVMLGHYDLGWHLAAGDLIRERGNIPFGDPWSFTAEDRQWFNLSWLWDVIASAIFQYAKFEGLTCPSSSYSPRFRWLFTLIGCCPGWMISKSKNRCWLPASSRHASCH